MKRTSTARLIIHVARASFALCALTLLGCGGSGVAVHGDVTLDGQPLAEGTIKLVPASKVKAPAVAAQIVGGRYAFDSEGGPVPGDYAIEIYAAEPPTPGLDDPDEYIRLGGPQGQVRPQGNRVDPKYNSQTTLRKTVSYDGETRLDFQVTSRPEP
jgi:hypothetical protein